MKITLELKDDLQVSVGDNVTVTGKVLDFVESNYEEIWLVVGGEEYSALIYENKIKGEIDVHELIDIIESGDISRLTEMTDGYFDEYTELKILRYNEPKTYEEVMVEMDYTIDYDYAKTNNVYKIF